MKKIIVSLLTIVNLLTINANAAWEFEEKTLSYANCAVVYDDGMIMTYTHAISMAEERYYGYRYYDFKGNQINKPVFEDSEDIYFSDNKLSLITTAEYGTALTDLEGNILATGFEIDDYYNEKNDVARVIKKETGYGIMAYDGRIIVPANNARAEIYGRRSNVGIYVATNEKMTDVYNYYGEKLFTLDDYIRIDSVYKNYIILRDSTDKCALANLNGECLTGFEYDEIVVYNNNEEWQSGTFIELINGNGRKYINADLLEIDIFSESGVYCKSYKVYGDVAVINNKINYSDTMCAVYNKTTGEFLLPFCEGVMLSNSEYMIYTYDDKSYMLDFNGNIVKDLEVERTYLLGDFKDGIAEVDSRSGQAFMMNKEIIFFLNIMN